MREIRINKNNKICLAQVTEEDLLFLKEHDIPFQEHSEEKNFVYLKGIDLFFNAYYKCLFNDAGVIEKISVISTIQAYSKKDVEEVIMNNRDNIDVDGDYFFFGTAVLTSVEAIKMLMDISAKVDFSTANKMLELIVQIKESASERRRFDVFKELSKKISKEKSTKKPEDFLIFKLVQMPEVVEVMSHVLRPNCDKLYLLYGIGGAGKSLILNELQQMTQQFFGSLPLSSIGVDDHCLTELVNKAIVSFDEFNGDYMNNKQTEVIKSVVTKNGITINPKHKKRFKYIPQSNFIFGCNSRPTFSVVDSGMARRMCICTFKEPIGSKLKRLGYDKDLNPQKLIDDLNAERAELMHFLITRDMNYSIIEDLQFKSVDKMLEDFEDLPDDLSYVAYKAHCINIDRKPLSKMRFEEFLNTVYKPHRKEVKSRKIDAELLKIVEENKANTQDNNCETTVVTTEQEKFDIELFTKD